MAKYRDRKLDNFESSTKMYELIFVATSCSMQDGPQQCEQHETFEYHGSSSDCQDRVQELWSAALSRGERLTYSRCGLAVGAVKPDYLYNFKYKDYSFRLNKIEIANFETSVLGDPASGQLHLRPGRVTRLTLTIKF